MDEIKVPDWLISKAKRYKMRLIRPVITAVSSDGDYSTIWQWLTKRGWKEVRQ